MKTYNSIFDYHQGQSVLTLGAFDGVHIGHKKILEKIIQNSKELDCNSLVITFFPHPRMVLQSESELQLLTTLAEKKQLLEKIGLDVLIIHPFDKMFSMMTADDFVRDVLVNQLEIKKMIIGYDHRFGKDRSATIDDLIDYGVQYGFEVSQITAQEIQENVVSSTLIRNAILEGNIALANSYLGYSYLLSGEVVQGNQLGRTIGFPTANINIKETYKLIPKIGVYVVKSTIDGIERYGMMNIGFRPTLNGKHQTIEVHFFDFDKDIYGTFLTIEVLHFIRNEEKFDSFELLKEQIQKDKISALEVISKKAF
ncbi:bifunctional riboflavin kinase/FAD synthetase [Flavobacterium aciduliphilum]|uniref:Riboflavin biosynthesis protein n=1 Tax=Flavobacterium aciduliphilum TaxID=1101402 RepID=A0A328YFE0_9FLAO|nr:bifunctional riboflavin kinase/FAD synthetase [Flavobacterium aciduliphilum]RAR72629.1 riboflavin kinase/FMN adenylyltransferase [Flavobacterium aciduliphilum]